MFRLTKMIKNIIGDFLNGIIHSLFFYKVISWKDPKLSKLLTKLLKYNFFMHIVPTLCIWFINYIVSFTGTYAAISVLVDLPYWFEWVNLIINIFSALFHLLHYIDLVNIISIYTSKATNNTSALDNITLAIIIALYQLVMYATTWLIHLLFNKFHYFVLVIEFIILAMYHSFYCSNNLWHYKKIDMMHRIEIIEKIWPYHIGYGTIATLIYFQTDNPFVLALYNLYLAFIITIPFLTDPKYPTKEKLYPKINLNFFSSLLGWLFYFSKSLLYISFPIKIYN